jgi:hypothetical protein
VRCSIFAGIMEALWTALLKAYAETLGSERRPMGRTGTATSTEATRRWPGKTATRCPFRLEWHLVDTGNRGAMAGTTG